MTTPPKKMTRKQEYDFYAKAENQTPKGPARRRKQNLTELVPVRFSSSCGTSFTAITFPVTAVSENRILVVPSSLDPSISIGQSFHV